MKRLISISVIAALCTSCSLLASLSTPEYGNKGAITEGGYHQGNIATSSLLVPITKTLIATEDPGTGLYGYLNEYGVWVIKPQFRYAKTFNREIGIATVQILNGRWGAINSLAQTVINFSFTSQYDVDEAIRSIANGRYCGIDLWVMQDPETLLYGYLNYFGNWHIAPQYTYAKDMNSDGYAIVQFADRRWGAIDRNGKIVVQPNFTSQYDAADALRALIYR